MKKLMMFAAAVTIVGSAFALDVFDYKASVKNPDLKAVKVKYDGEKYTVTVKYISKSSLFGYVITECSNCIDEDGAAYLVAANKKTKVVGILPADLLAKVWPAKGDSKSKKWLAEGYLFAGCGKVTHPWDLYDTWGTCEYGASSEYLFGIYNRAATITDEFGDVYVTFADAWLDAAGFGKAAYVSGSEGDLCEEDGTPCLLLDSLAGSVIGGMFLCAESYAEVVLCNAWSLTTDVVSGVWAIKRNSKLEGVAPSGNENTTGSPEVDAMVHSAIKALHAGTAFDDVVPSEDDGPDFPRVEVLDY
jgi:hypothetical protein